MISKEILKDFENHLKKSKSSSTAQRYRSQLKRFFLESKIELSEISEFDFQEYFHWLRKANSESVVHSRETAVRAFLKYRGIDNPSLGKKNELLVKSHLELQGYVNYLQQTKSPRTTQTYIAKLMAFFSETNLTPSEFRHFDLQAYFDNLAKKHPATTVHSQATVVRSFMRYLGIDIKSLSLPSISSSLSYLPVTPEQMPHDSFFSNLKKKVVKPDKCSYKCPMCKRQLKRQGGMHISVALREHIQKNKEVVTKDTLRRQLQKDPPKIKLPVDLEYAMELEAGALGIDVNTLITQICDGYIEDERRRLKRRGERKRK